ncbi:hypothetical protein [Streptomyces sp. CB01201]|uniref:hypothetical protein n=1 Tax=Streptomyces sp. CB01201 TaxID=2020324 RepID=UPI001F28D5CB|nr:hypothetical protein [Streptomyces sp. CB01201]
MTIHRPGLPGDLPEPELLWARWGLLAVLEASTEEENTPSVHRTGHWADAGGLHLDDCGCTWWTLAQAGGGRFVLYGEDESSDVKWYRPAVDMLAGAPDWLPYAKLRDLIEGHELGCVYWYENGAWARAPYPEGLADDGLDCGMNRFVDRGDVLGAIDLGGSAETDPELLRDPAERGLLTTELVESAVSGSECGHGDLPAMLGALRLAGVSAHGGEGVTGGDGSSHAPQTS